MRITENHKSDNIIVRSSRRRMKPRKQPNEFSQEFRGLSRKLERAKVITEA